MDEFIEFTTRACRRSPAFELGQYIENSINKNLDDVIEEVISDDFKSKNILKFCDKARKTHDVFVDEMCFHMGLGDKYNITVGRSKEAEEFKIQCKKELMQKALSNDVKISKRQYQGVQSEIANLRSCDYIINVNGLDKKERIGEHLKFLSSIAEFHTGHSLFEYEKNAQLQQNELEKSTAVSQDDGLEETEADKSDDSPKKQHLDDKVTLGQLAILETEENMLHALWESGFLKCDLDR